MSDPEDKTRKTVTLTHRQLGWGGGVIAALAMVSQLKGTFYSREEGVAQSREIADLKAFQTTQFAELRLFISASQEEQVRRLERSNDKLVDRIKETEGRAAKAEDRMNLRMDALEGLKTRRSTN